jgi:hypothetical protein
MKEDEESKKVMLNYLRVKGGEVIKEARNYADSSKFDEAKALLNAFKEEVTSSLYAQEPPIVLLQKDLNVAIDLCDPKIYEEKGKHKMIGISRARFQQKLTFDSADYFKSDYQDKALQQVYEKKYGGDYN